MKFKILVSTLFICLFSFGQQKIACIGDSVTWGSTIKERARNNYPAYLQYLFGDTYEVKNFGVPGATALRKGDKPYTDQEKFKQALSFAPDIALIMLGTNDSKPQNFKFKSEIKTDLNFIVTSLKEANPKVEVIIMTPVYCTSTRENSIHKDRVAPITTIVKEFANEHKFPLVDTQTPFVSKLSDKKTGVKIPDGIHPNSFGAELIAKEVYKQISGIQQPNFATYALPSMEYRGGAAGWGGGTWWKQLDNINTLIETQKDSIELVLFGDSITQNWTGSKKRSSDANGKRPIDQILSKYGAISAGISGDRVEMLSYRAEQHFKDFKPKYLSIMIGVNNFLYKANNGKEVGEGIVALIHKLKKITPNTEIILFATFPNGRTEKERQETKNIHQLIEPLGKLNKVHYIDLTSELLDTNGKLSSKYFGKDAVHPKKGPTYTMWAHKIDEVIKSIK